MRECLADARAKLLDEHTYSDGPDSRGLWTADNTAMTSWQEVLFEKFEKKRNLTFTAVVRTTNLQYAATSIESTKKVTRSFYAININNV